MVLPLDGASSPHRLVILITGVFVSPPAGSSRHWLALLATGWFFLLLATAGSSRHPLVLLSTANCSLGSALQPQCLGEMSLSLCSADAVVSAASCARAVSAMRLYKL
jgi:hypothetical protein